MNDEIYNYIFDIRFALNQMEHALKVPDDVNELQDQLTTAMNALEEIGEGYYSTELAAATARDALDQLRNPL